MSLAAFSHHSAPWRQTKARAGEEGHEEHLPGELFNLEEEPGGGLPAPLSKVAGRQDKVVRHVLEISAPSARSSRSLIFLCRM